jgi:hypothetical protein
MIFVPTYDSSLVTVVWLRYLDNIYHTPNPDKFERKPIFHSETTSVKKFKEWRDGGLFLNRRVRNVPNTDE